MVCRVKLAEVDIYKENDQFTHRCFVIQQWQLLLPTKYWPGKASERENWVGGLKKTKTEKHIPQRTPPSPHPKNPQNQITQPSNFNFFFFVKLHLKCSVKGQTYKFQEWEQILYDPFLLYSGEDMLLTMWGEQSAELQQSSPGNTSYSHGTVGWMDAIHIAQLWMQNTN